MGNTLTCEDEAKREELVAQDPKSDEIIKPLLRGRDVKRWQVNFVGQYLITIESSENRAHPWSGQVEAEAEHIFTNTYPAIHAHFEPFREQLISRWDQGKYFWELRPCAYWGEFEKEKIVWQEMATKGTFLIDRNKFYSLDTTRILTVKNLTCFIGILNSKFFLFAFKNYYAGGHLGSRGVRFKSEFMKRFPVPPITEANQHLVTQIEARVDQILDAKRTNPNANVSGLEKEIDQIVYLLYDLTPEEITIVEGAENL